MAVATASSIGTVQSQPPIPRGWVPKLRPRTPDSGFVPGIEAESGSGTTEHRKANSTASTPILAASHKEEHLVSITHSEEGLGGGGKGSRGYSSVKTYNYKFDSNDPSNGAKQA
ncbi:hypothetical protein MRX96_008822 [Rhipicephalus microplus]